MYTVPLCRPLSWCSTEFPDNIMVTVTLGAVVKGKFIRRDTSLHAFSFISFAAPLTLGGLIADDEAIYFAQTGCPLQQSFGVGHVDDSKMCRRGRYCQEKDKCSLWLPQLAVQTLKPHPHKYFLGTRTSTHESVPVVMMDVRASLWVLPCVAMTETM